MPFKIFFYYKDLQASLRDHFNWQPAPSDGSHLETLKNTDN